MTTTHLPYENLNPDTILNAIESTGLQSNGSLFPLNSYENRVYQVGVEGGAPVIAKFYRAGRWSDEAILEEHEFACELASHEIPVVAPIADKQGNTLHTYDEFRFAIFPRRAGRIFELDNAEHLEWIGRFIGRIHAVGACKPFKHRLTLNAQHFGYMPYQYLMDNHFIPDTIKYNFEDAAKAALTGIDDCFNAVGEVPLIRLHGDCHAGNVLWDGTGPVIVDLDDCLQGPAVQDIWMLLSGSTAANSKAQLNIILDGYNEFYDFFPRQIHLIEALRTLRMIHYAGWLARRWDDPAFPVSFPWFNTPRYWEEQIQHLRDQAALLQEGISDL